MQATAKTLTLSSGDKMPIVGFGCWKIGKDVCADTVYNAIKAGYRCIDEAADYGNEKEAGQGIKKALDEGIVKREDLWVTSKLWNTYHRKEHVKLAVKKSLEDLGLEYLDLYLIHFPIALKFVPFEKRYPPEWFHDPEAADKRMEEDLVPYRETWEAMEELVNEGLVKNIGACNIGTSMLRDVLRRVLRSLLSATSAPLPTSSSAWPRPRKPSSTTPSSRKLPVSMARLLLRLSSAGPCSAALPSSPRPLSLSAWSRTATCSASSCLPRK